MRAIGPTNARYALPFLIENTTLRKWTISGIRRARCIFECALAMETITSCVMIRGRIVGLWTATGKHGSLNNPAVFCLR
jgi:hypothetical protein